MSNSCVLNTTPVQRLDNTYITRFSVRLTLKKLVNNSFTFSAVAAMVYKPSERANLRLTLFHNFSIQTLLFTFSLEKFLFCKFHRFLFTSLIGDVYEN